MGVYIPNMEMPKTCGKCQIKNAIECNRWKLVRSVVLDRHKDCPLVPVPPHGRLIDADAIPYNKIMIEDDDFYYGITQPRIERMPTIIPAEEGET